MILVTGATGHLGAHVLYELVKANRTVRAIYRDTKKTALVNKIFSYYQSDYLRLLDKIEWVQADVIDYSSLMEHMQDVRQVYHIAGLVSFNNKDKQKLNRVNTVGTANVVNACIAKGIEKLIHVSSIATLGELNDYEPVHENVIWNLGLSASAYAVSKFRGEMEVWRGIHEGLNAVIVNPSVIVGPGMWLGPGKQLFTSIFKGLKYYPSGSSGYVDVRDVARTMIILAESHLSGERYILSSENITNRLYINLLADAMGRKRPRFLVTPLIASIAATFDAIRATLTGLPPRINLQTIEIASDLLAYSNTKVRDALGIAFIPIEESVNLSVQLYLNELNSAHE